MMLMSISSILAFEVKADSILEVVSARQNIIVVVRNLRLSILFLSFLV